MKKLTIITALALTLASCTSNYHNVKLKNGSVISAYDEDNRNFSKGDTVCVSRIRGDWSIDRYGNMEDTTYYRRLDSTSYTVQYAIGIIK